jgi:ABC-type glycerol-3-phosphate transport system substrate-binding protein
MKAKLFAMLAAFVLISTVCAPQAASAADTIELTWLTFETPVITSAFWEATIADGLKRANLPNVTIKRLNAPGIDRSTYAKQLIAAGTVPDLMQSINTQDFAESGLLMPWDAKWCEEHFLMPYATALNGKIWQAPTNSQIIPMVFYNKDIFKKAGVAVPKNWKEFQNVSNKLKKAGYKPLQVVGAGDGIWASGLTLCGIISSDVLGTKPDWVTQRKTGNARFSDADMASAFGKFKWLVDNGAIDKADLGTAYADANIAFINQKAAMYFMGSWFLAQAGNEAKFNIGVFLFPRDDGKLIVPFSVGGGIHMSAKTAHPQEVQAFAQAVALSPAFMRDIIEKDGAISMVKGMKLADYGVTVSALYKEGLGYVGKKGASNVDAFSWVNNDSALIAGLTDEFNKSAQAIITGADVKAELARLDKVWDANAQ